MRVVFPVLAVVMPAAAALLAASCSSETPAAAIGLVMKTEAALLDGATSVRLSVFDGEASACGDDGSAGAIPDDAQEFQLGREGCEGGASWCGEIELDRDGSTKVFHVEARGPDGLLAQGCAAATIDQDPLTVAIKVVRYVPPGCCNDGVLQVGEQCDSGVAASLACGAEEPGACGGIVADAVCACDCTTSAVAVDRRAEEPAPPPGQKAELALAFAPGAAELSGALRAAFTDVGPEATGGADVVLRYLTPDAAPFDPVTNADVADPLRIPLACTNPRGSGSGRQQQSPALAPLTQSATALVYRSNEVVSTRFDAFLLHLGGQGCADDAPVRVNPDDVEVTAVDVAGGPAGIALVVYAQGGAVRGRFWSEGSGFADAFEIAAQGSSPRAAGSPMGWVVAYQGPSGNDVDGVVARTVLQGPQLGPPIAVNLQTQGLQDQPDVAMLPDGRFAVAWRSGGDVLAQRYGADGVAVEGDQQAPVNTTTEGEQSSPVLEGSGASGSFFVAGWADGSGAIRARFLGAGAGFLFNSVTGQNDEFDATPSGSAGARTRPALAVGGNGHVAIGWQDDTSGGVYVRRFPLPTTQ
jgi:hypothetical protein